MPPSETQVPTQSEDSWDLDLSQDLLFPISAQWSGAWAEFTWQRNEHLRLKYSICLEDLCLRKGPAREVEPLGKSCIFRQSFHERGWRR